MTTPHEKALAVVGNIAPQDELREHQHTPTPWMIRDRDNGYLEIVIDRRPTIHTGDGAIAYIEMDYVSGEEDRANAALIVRAVNRDHLFDELVRMLTKVRRVLHDDGYARIVLECDAILAKAKADRDFLNS